MIFSKTVFEISSKSTSFKKEISILSHIAKKLKLIIEFKNSLGKCHPVCPKNPLRFCGT